MPLHQSSAFGDADYEAIEAALSETARGRWFVAEHLRRNRGGDTETLLAAMHRLERAMAGQQAPQMPAGVRAVLLDMSRAIDRAKSQIAASRPDVPVMREIGEFDSLAQSQEEATAEILHSAERVQDLAWNLRERGFDEGHCATLEARAADIYAACATHEMVTHHARRVAHMLRFLEGRLGTLLALTGGEAVDPADLVIGDVSESGQVETADPFTPVAARLSLPEAPGQAQPANAAAPADDDPLAGLKALTPEERLALFS